MLGSAGTHLAVSPLRTPADVRTPAVWAENDTFPVIAPSSLPRITRDRPQRARNVREGDGGAARTDGGEDFTLVWRAWLVRERMV